jgi:hypothetical protein
VFKEIEDELVKYYHLAPTEGTEKSDKKVDKQ